MPVYSLTRFYPTPRQSIPDNVDHVLGGIWGDELHPAWHDAANYGMVTTSSGGIRPR